VIGGYLSTTLGGKGVLGNGVVVWSMFTMLTPPAAATGSLPTLLATRLAMGCGEGVTFPCVQNLIKGWSPSDTRSRCLSLVYSGAPQLPTFPAPCRAVTRLVQRAPRQQRAAQRQQQQQQR
jgi:MFS transporter, ACS family, solute carrier family 17 (sodium-dependent inorganic phosphate cotransporter), other